MPEASWINTFFRSIRRLRSRALPAPVPRQRTGSPEPNPVVQVGDQPAVQQDLPRQAQRAESLEMEWTRGYQAGCRELDAAIGPVPRMPIISIPSQADGLAHVYLVGWEAGIRSAAAALGA